MRRYELFIFDFDGTLADSAAWMIRTLNDVAGHFGLRRVSDEEIAMLRGKSNTEIIRYLGVPMWKLPRIATEMRQRVARDIDQIKPFPGTDELLRSLHASGAKVAVVSSNSEDNVRRVLGDATANCIHTFECNASIFGKAHKLRAVMKRLHTHAGATLCIGDETRDIEAARQVGAASGAVTWGYATKEVLATFRPTHTFASMSEIAALAV
jgi:phosphoglycolate phosphatase